MDPPKGAKGQENAPRKSRGQGYGEDQDLPLPELEDGMHIVSALMEAGPLGTGAMGVSPLGWSEINTWHQASASPLQPHELRLLRRLSSVFAEQLEKSRDPMCPSPEVVAVSALDGKKLAAKIKDVLRG